MEKEMLRINQFACERAELKNEFGEPNTNGTTDNGSLHSDDDPASNPPSVEDEEDHEFDLTEVELEAMRAVKMGIADLDSVPLPPEPTAFTIPLPPDPAPVFFNVDLPMDLPPLLPPDLDSIILPPEEAPIPSELPPMVPPPTLLTAIALPKSAPPKKARQNSIGTIDLKIESN